LHPLVEAHSKRVKHPVRIAYHPIELLGVASSDDFDERLAPLHQPAEPSSDDPTRTRDPTGSVVVAGGGDGLLRFWDASSGKLLWTLPAHKSHVIGIHFEGDDLVTRGFGGDVARWTLPKPEQVIAACDACNAAIPARGTDPAAQ
jgi:WD40 repeat protein